MPENPFTAAPNHRPLHKRVMLKKRKATIRKLSTSHRSHVPRFFAIFERR